MNSVTNIILHRKTDRNDWDSGSSERYLVINNVMTWLWLYLPMSCVYAIQIMLSRILTDTTLRRSHNWPHWRRSRTWPRSFPLYWRRSPQWCHTQWLLLLQLDIDHLQVVWAFYKTGAKVMLMSDCLTSLSISIFSSVWLRSWRGLQVSSGLLLIIKRPQRVTPLSEPKILGLVY